MSDQEYNAALTEGDKVLIEALGTDCSYQQNGFKDELVNKVATVVAVKYGGLLVQVILEDESKPYSLINPKLTKTK